MHGCCGIGRTSLSWYSFQSISSLVFLRAAHQQLPRRFHVVALRRHMKKRATVRKRLVLKRRARARSGRRGSCDLRAPQNCTLQRTRADGSARRRRRSRGCPAQRPRPAAMTRWAAHVHALPLMGHHTARRRGTATSYGCCGPPRLAAPARAPCCGRQRTAEEERTELWLGSLRCSIPLFRSPTVGTGQRR